MNTQMAVKLGVSRQVVIPKKLHDEMGLVAGDYFDVARFGKKIVLTPKTMLDKSLEESLARSFSDVKAGREYGPFDTAEEMIASLHRESKKLRAEMKKIRSKK